MMISHCDASPISHIQNGSSLETMYEELIQKIQIRGDLPHVSVQEQLNILKQLKQFSFGQFLIQNRGGLNGYWTEYVISHPFQGRKTGLDKNGKSFSPLEDFLLNRAPLALAIQERFTIFQKELQKRCHNGVVLASVPCGLMKDLLTLNFDNLNDYRLIGVDIDINTINDVQTSIKGTHFQDKVCLQLENAWDFCLSQKADVITSNGLNFYEHDDKRVIELYRQFYNNLKPGGVLIVSFFTPPPLKTTEPEWIFSEINPKDALIQRIIIADILNATWQAYRSTKLTIDQLTKAGFENIEIHPDIARLAPTAVAYRAL